MRALTVFVFFFMACVRHPTTDELNEKQVDTLNGLKVLISPPPGRYDQRVNVQLTLEESPGIGEVVIRTRTTDSNWALDQSCQLKGELWVGTCVEIASDTQLYYKLFLDGELRADDNLPEVTSREYVAEYQIGDD